MHQYIFSIKLTPGGAHYCVAYTPSGNKAVAVSRYSYDNGSDALIDVVKQLGLLPDEQPKPGLTQRMLSAAAGGVR